MSLPSTVGRPFFAIQRKLMPDPAARPEWERRFFSAIKPVFDDARPAIQRGPLSFSWPTFRAQIAAAAKDQYTETFLAA